jgi:Fic family protein
MSRQALLLEAHHTTHIEGTQLTLEESARLWAGQKVPTANQDDARELLNYRGAFNLVSEYLDSGEPITEGLIREIYKRLVEGVRGGEGGPGTYRRVQNYVVNSATREVLYTPPPPEDVPALMRHLVVWLRADTDLHPVLIAGIAQYQLVHIHPFLDGNGRTSRLLSTLCLYRAGYDFKRLFTLSQFYDRDRPAFYRAIRSVAERDMDMTGWLEFFVGGLATQLGEIVTSGKRVMLSHVVAGRYGLNERQTSIVELLLEQPEVRIEDVEGRLPKANRRTLQRDLQDLVKRRIVASSGAARTVRYQLKIKGLATNRDRIATRIATESRRQS